LLRGVVLIKDKLIKGKLIKGKLYTCV